MYSTCLFCHGDLGRNEVIEHFPVGRRLAFDAAKGRLWVVCRKCERWNLTPLEERWEAIEDCERAYRDTRLRVATEHIGLARVREGLELVRIGAPQRPEMAAWRYGDQFGRRTRRNLLIGGASAAGLLAVMWGAPLLGLYTGSAVTGVHFLINAGQQWRHRRLPIARIPVLTGDGVLRLPLARLHVGRVALVSETHGWHLRLPYLSEDDHLEYTVNGLRHLTAHARLEGDEARRAAAQILPLINTMVARKSTVTDAVGLLERAASPDGAFAAAAKMPATSRWSFAQGKSMAGSLAALPTAVRLALEMAAHEESERRALEGELHVLEAAWKDAEEIAGIADDMFFPPSVESDLARLKNEPR